MAHPKLTPMERRELLIFLRPKLIERARHEERLMRGYESRGPVVRRTGARRPCADDCTCGRHRRQAA